MKWNDLLFSILVCALLSCSASDDKLCPDASCDDYSTQTAAQAAYDSNRDCFGELDDDSDGVACEHLATTGGSTGGSTGSTSCPTTANCGCSNKNKDQCGGNCCKWVVGDGCKCK